MSIIGLDQSWCIPWGFLMINTTRVVFMIKRKRAIAMRIPYHPKTVKVPHMYMILSEYSYNKDRQ